MLDAPQRPLSGEERVELGTLVLCSSFRNPGLVAKMAATADMVSGGRLILGLGAGWYQREYTSFGFPYDHRVSRFAEALEIVSNLLEGDSASFEGRYHTIRAAALLPPPDRRIPILVAAHRPRMMRLTARLANVWATAWYEQPDAELRTAVDEFDSALAAEGRDPAEVGRAIGLFVRDPEQPRELAAALQACEQLGFDHAIALCDPATSRSVKGVAAAARISRQ